METFDIKVDGTEVSLVDSDNSSFKIKITPSQAEGVRRFMKRVGIVVFQSECVNIRLEKIGGMLHVVAQTETGTHGFSFFTVLIGIRGRIAGVSSSLKHMYNV